MTSLPRTRIPLALLCLVVLGAGCESVGSDAVRTAGLYASMSVESDGDGVSDVVAFLRVGGPTSNVFVDLTGGDRLLVWVDGTSHVMKRQRLGDLLWYSADIVGDTEDMAFQLELKRVFDVDAPDSSVTMPAPFEIVFPVGEEQISRDEDLSLAWEPGDTADRMVLSVSGECINSYQEDLDDDGLHNLPPASLRRGDFADEDACEATLVLARVRDGVVDPAYGDGHIEARHVREVTFTTKP